MPPRQQVLDARLARIKTALAALGALRPGTLSAQYNVCGKPGCRCKADPPQKHGPYYQVSFTWQGKSHSEFVRREDLATVRQQVGTYQRLRSLVDAWIATALELAQLQRHAARAREAKSPARSRVSPKTSGRRVSAVAPSRARTP
ncbi:MAG: DUF6788 family protein [Egibacteraceae bacterium]